MEEKKKTVGKESPILTQGCGGGGSEQKTLKKPQRCKSDQSMPPLISNFIYSK